MKMCGNFSDSMQMIKILDIKSEKGYEIVFKSYDILSSKRLKYILKTDNFKEIIPRAQKY